MPEMGARWGLGIVLVVVLGACVPTPAGRVAASGNATTGSPAAAGVATPASASPFDPNATPSFMRPTPNPGPTFLAHQVTAGESLTTIARLFGTTARSIAYWNRDRYPSLDPDSEAYDPNRIEIGWTLLLIPTEVVAEDELPDPTPTPVAPTPDATGSPS